MSIRTATLSLLMALAAFTGGLSADELVTTEGTRLTGTFVKVEGGNVYFADKTLGEVKVSISQVAGLSLDSERTVKVRRGDDVRAQQDAVIFTRDGELFVRGADGQDEAVPLANLRGVNEEVPETRALWSASLIGVFGWTEGNTETYSLGFRGDLKRETKHNLQGIYAEGNYLQDRKVEEQQVRRRDYAVGYYYRYIFDFGLTMDFTEDVTFNELAGYHWRSITGFGPGYYLVRKETLWAHVGAHLTYTYEDLMNGADDRGYWGARARGEVDWVNDERTFHGNFRTEVLFDFDESKNIVVNNTLLLEAKLKSWLSAGLLARHSWDNLPTPGFEKNDFALTFTIGITWSGRGL